MGIGRISRISRVARVGGGPILFADLMAKLTGGGVWELDEASGDAIDALGASTLADNNTVGAGVGKVHATARDFERTATEFFSIADNANVSMGDIDFTLEAWVNLDSPAALSQMIVAKDVLGSREYFLAINAASVNRFDFIVSGNGTDLNIVTADSFGGVSASTWYHLLAWHDATANQIGISVNGTANTAAHATGVFDGTATFCIGARQYVGNEDYVGGLIGPVRLYKGILTDVEKAYLFNGGAGRAYPFTF